MTYEELKAERNKYKRLMEQATKQHYKIGHNMAEKKYLEICQQIKQMFRKP